jgi:transposase
MYADAGYVTENTLSQAEQNGMELLGPTRPDPHKGPYNADAFKVDIDKGQAICPQGNLSTQSSRIRDTYMGTEYYRIEWGNQCDGCPVQNQCTRAKNGRRILVVGLRHDLVEKRRKEMREAEFSKSMHPRNGIEGTHSELVRGHGLRRTKYRGAESHRFIALFHGGGLQCEAIFESARFPDENSRSEPCIRAMSEPLFMAVAP